MAEPGHVDPLDDPTTERCPTCNVRYHAGCFVCLNCVYVAEHGAPRPPPPPKPPDWGLRVYALVMIILPLLLGVWVVATNW